MLIPIFIPMRYTPETCPSCGKEENKIEVCKYCKHEYADDTATYPYWWVSLLLDIGLFFLLFYIVDLLFNYGLNEDVWWNLPLAIFTVLTILFSMIIVWPLLSKDKVE